MCKRVGVTLVLLALTAALVSVGAQGEEKTDKSGKAYLGIVVEPTPPGVKRAGLIVRDVAPDSPAAKGKLKAGDVILKVDKTEVKDYEQLLNAVSGHKPGDQITVKVARDGEEQELTLKVGARKVRRPGEEPGRGRPTAYLGVQTQPLTPALREQLGVPADLKGVAVMEVFPETPASKAGLKRKDVITRAGGKEVAEPKDLREAVAEAGAGKELKLTVQRGKESVDLTAQLREPPVDGLNLPFPIRPPSAAELPSLPRAMEKISDLEQKVRDLEKRLKQLEEKAGK